MELKVVEFIKAHENWEELLSKEPYCLKISRDDNYIMFKYNQIESDFSNEIVRECRGLILRAPDFAVVCHPFNKFGNYGESYCPEIDWASASVQQKVDGSLMKVWFDNGRWHISTNGTIDAYKAPLNSVKYKSFGELFLAALPVYYATFINDLCKGYTYMFELVSPENRVVIPYEKTELYFLGARNNETQEEVMPEQTHLAYGNSFKIPKRYELHSLEDVKNAASELPWDEEGYVVCDKYFNRVKIKSPEYVRAHYARLNNCISYEHIMEVILEGEQAEFLIYASDYKEELEKLDTAYNSILKEVKETIEKLNPASFASRKDYALTVLTKPHWIQAFLFAWDKLDAHILKVTPEKWVELMKEKGDINE